MGWCNSSLIFIKFTKALTSKYSYDLWGAFEITFIFLPLMQRQSDPFQIIFLRVASTK